MAKPNQKGTRTTTYLFVFGARGRDRRLALGDQQTRGLGGLGLKGVWWHGVRGHRWQTRENKSAS